MRQNWIIFGCGAIVFLLPLLGFPRNFNNTLYLLTGLLLMTLSIRTIRKQYLKDFYDQDKNSG